MYVCVHIKKLTCRHSRLSIILFSTFLFLLLLLPVGPSDPRQGQGGRGAMLPVPPGRLPRQTLRRRGLRDGTLRSLRPFAGRGAGATASGWGARCAWDSALDNGASLSNTFCSSVCGLLRHAVKQFWFLGRYGDMDTFFHLLFLLVKVHYPWVGVWHPDTARNAGGRWSKMSMSLPKS